MLDIVITTNSPGEVAAWVRPAVKELKKNYTESRISVFLPPCVFASGSEKKVLEDFSGIDLVFGRKEYLKYILTGKKPAGFKPGEKGIVIFLGGDLYHAILLGKKLDYPVIAYTEGVFNKNKKIDFFMVPDEKVRDRLVNNGIKEERVKVIGNLMLDAVDPKLTIEETKALVKARDEFIISLFPGSRIPEVEYMLPFFLKSILYLKKSHKNSKFLLSQSPFVNNNKLFKIFKGFLEENNLQGNFYRQEDYSLLQVEDLEIKVLPNLQYSLMQITDLALTIPGTNNLELAYFGIPMIVVLPLNKPEDIPLEGIVGLLGQIPILGKILKRLLVPRIGGKIPYVSLVNSIAGEEVVPEIRGVLKPEDLVKVIEKLLGNKKKLNKIHQQLKKSVGVKGAASNLTVIVGQVLASYH